MPGVWTPHTIEGSELVISPEQNRQIVTGVVEDMEVDCISGNQHEIMWDAMESPGFPAYESELSGHPSLLLRRIILRAISHRALRAWLIYETLGFGFTPSSWFLQDSSYLQQRYTQFLMPQVTATKTALKLGFEDPDTGAIVPEDVVEVPYLAPMRALRAFGLVAGSPPPTDKRLRGTVNAVSWPTITGEPSYPAGYWMMTRYDVVLSRYTGYSQVEIEFLTRETHDWSEWKILFDPSTGHHVSIDDSELDSAQALAYSNAIIYAGNGFLRVGNYALTDFGSILGF